MLPEYVGMVVCTASGNSGSKLYILYNIKLNTIDSKNLLFIELELSL